MRAKTVLPAVLLGALLAPAAAAQSAAQSAAHAPQQAVRDARTPVVIDMDADVIVGAPVGPQIQVLQPAPTHRYKSLIQLRKDFRSEILATGSRL